MMKSVSKASTKFVSRVKTRHYNGTISSIWLLDAVARSKWKELQRSVQRRCRNRRNCEEKAESEMDGFPSYTAKTILLKDALKVR